MAGKAVNLQQLICEIKEDELVKNKNSNSVQNCNAKLKNALFSPKLPREGQIKEKIST